MKKILMVISVFSISLTAQAAQVTGFWKMSDNRTGKPVGIVRVYEENGVTLGKIVVPYHANGTPGIVINEHGRAVCDETFLSSLPGRPPLCGLVVLNGFRFNQRRGFYDGGTITNPKTDRTYRAEMWVNDSGNLAVRGRWSIFSRKETARPFTEQQLAALFDL